MGNAIEVNRERAAAALRRAGAEYAAFVQACQIILSESRPALPGQSYARRGPIPPQVQKYLETWDADPAEPESGI